MLKLGHYKIGRLAGINVYLHLTFILFIGVLFLISLFSSNTAVNLVLLTGVFSFVVLHELGHALAARKYGIPTESITLYPIGGVAKIMGQPKNSMEEIVISLAGPAVNVVLAGVFFPLGYLFGNFGAGIFSEIFKTLGIINAGLAIFNLLPAFPMDGGRVLRALLARISTQVRATQNAATVGKVFALGFILLPLFTQASWVLALIGVFIWQAGNREVEIAKLKSRSGWQNGPFTYGPHGGGQNYSNDFKNDDSQNIRNIFFQNGQGPTRVFTFRFRRW